METFLISMMQRGRRATEGCGVMNGNNGKRQISFRLPTEMAEEVKAAADRESFHEVAPFARALFKWAFTQYKQAGGLLLLKEPQLNGKNVRAKK